MLISGLQGIGPRDLVVRTILNFVKHDLGTYAAALAFSALLALFPFTIFLLGLVGALDRPDFFDWLLDQARLTLPTDAYGSVRQVIDEVRSREPANFISLAIGLALWAASAGVRSLMTGLNAAYDMPESRPIWVVYPLSVLYTVGLAVLASLAAALMLLGPQTAQRLATYVGLSNEFVAVWEWARLPAAVVLVLLAVATVYFVAPDVEQPFVLVTPGSVLTVTVWLAASAGFSFFISRFGNFGATYGSLAGVIVLLLYLFLSSAVLLLGAALNAVIYHYVRRRGLVETEPETTVQPDPAAAVVER